MSLSATLTRTWTYGTDRLSQDDTVTSGTLVSIDETIPGASTDLLLALVLDVSQMQAAFIQADRDMTLEFNSNAGSGGSIALKANKPYIWSANCGLVNTMATDVTALYVTLAAGADSVLKARFLIDPTV